MVKCITLLHKIVDNFLHNTKTLLPSKEYNIFQHSPLIMDGRRDHPNTKEGMSHSYSPLMTTSLLPSKEQRFTYFPSVKDLVKISAACCSIGQYSRERIPYATIP